MARISGAAAGGGYNASIGGAAIKALLTALILAGLFVAMLGLLRVPFAVRFWRRVQWLMWVYLAVVILAAVRLYLTG